MMKGRKLTLIGDSSMIQVFQSFVCNLRPSVISNLNMDWHHFKWGLYNKTICPFPDGKHCHIKGVSTMEIPYLNIRITFHKHDKPNERIFESIIGDKYTKEDIVIINFGQHYNEKSEFFSILNKFSIETKKFENRRSNSPKLFFLESFPVYFDSNEHNPVGYYIYDGKPFYQSTIKCIPHYANISEAINMIGEIIS